ncbi:MAG: NAD(P)H-binding protein [Candidatus Aureabacteria bacterium]|nr:NAD(P)H-binding protein [Candidatus Auribacterota bacterium]
MKIIVTGGTGFTGKRVLPLLKGKGSILCLTRKKDHFPLIRQYGYEPLIGDVKNPDALRASMEECDGLINIVSLGFGDADLIVTAAEKAGIRRAVFVSTTAVETRLNARSKAIRLQAEERIKRSHLDWAILRPTMIYGGQDDRNISRFIRFIKRMPFFPIPGSGEFLQQPVHVKDVAEGIVQAFFSPNASKKIYNLSGAAPISFNRMVETACQTLGVSRKIIHCPVQPVLFIFQFWEKFSSKPFLKSEQILRLLEDKTFSHEEALKDFDFQPRSFEEGLKEMMSFEC